MDFFQAVHVNDTIAALDDLRRADALLYGELQAGQLHWRREGIIATDDGFNCRHRVCDRALQAVEKCAQEPSDDIGSCRGEAPD